MPHHEHEVEVFDARTNGHLGAATLADQASSEQIAELRRTREARRRRLAADLRSAEKSRRTRYAAATTAEPPQPVTAVTAAQAAAEVGDADDEQLRTEALPLFVPLRPPRRAGCFPAPRRRPSRPRSRTSKRATQFKMAIRKRDWRSDMGRHRRAG